MAPMAGWDGPMAPMAGWDGPMAPMAGWPEIAHIAGLGWPHGPHGRLYGSAAALVRPEKI